jgi:hypothetical protein
MDCPTAFQIAVSVLAGVAGILVGVVITVRRRR